MAVDVVGPILDAIIVALAILLGLIAGLSAFRYKDVRFGFVAGALVVLGLVGVVGAIGLLLPGAFIGSDLGVAPSALIIAAEVLFYLSFVVARPWTPPTSSR